MLYVMEWEVCVWMSVSYKKKKSLNEFNGYIMTSQFSMDESFTLSDMIALLLHSSFVQQVSNAFFFTFYIAFILSISHLCSCLYYICTVQKVHINYPVQNKSKWAQTSYLFMCCVVSCFHNLCIYFLFLFIYSFFYRKVHF